MKFLLDRASIRWGLVPTDEAWEDKVTETEQGQVIEIKDLEELLEFCRTNDGSLIINTLVESNGGLPLLTIYDENVE